MSLPADTREQLDRFLPAFLAGTDRVVVELRALGCPRQYGGPVTKAGFFELPAARHAFEKAVDQLLADPAGQPDGVYVTMNPLDPALLARANNRLKDQAPRRDGCAADVNVLSRRWVVIDCDPVRVAGVSATDVEKAAAKYVIDGVRQDLDGRGWPAPLVVDSGNGFHLWYLVHLPRDDAGLVARILKTLAEKHDIDAAKIDTSIFNPSRIAKLPGTWARKGDPTPDRPHRLSRVLEAPA